MQTLFALFIYLSAFGLNDIMIKEFKISIEVQIIMYLVLGFIGFYNYKNVSNNIYGENKKTKN